ncbi:DUF4153 domain-containing protein [Planotetraspora sp. GP83]|uniref:DUF4153 domain-containing protein n=1 Tax=Planotetraspora sp. GP83 TaxID=3156264 RepID=UPI0035158E35
MRPLDFLGRIKVKLGIVIVLAVVTAFVVNEVGINAGLSRDVRIAIAVLLALIMVQLLARGMTKPLREMAAAAQTIAKGRYGLRVSATSRDEVGELARAFNAMAADLGEVDRQRRELVANVSHELRTPITGLQAVLENVVDGVSPPDLDTLGTALAQTQRLGRLVAQLLDLSRLDSGARLIDPEVLDLASLCRQAASEAGLVREDVTVVSEVAPGTELHADPALLAQVLANLLDNAVRHSPPGGSVWLEARSAGADVELSVTDCGPGIPPGERARIFERFSRLDAGRAADAGGAGLGLAITKEIVELHGGSIGVADPGAEPARKATGSGAKAGRGPHTVGCRMVVHLPGRAVHGDTTLDPVSPSPPEATEIPPSASEAMGTPAAGSEPLGSASAGGEPTGSAAAGRGAIGTARGGPEVAQREQARQAVLDPVEMVEMVDARLPVVPSEPHAVPVISLSPGAPGEAVQRPAGKGASGGAASGDGASAGAGRGPAASDEATGGEDADGEAASHDGPGDGAGRGLTHGIPVQGIAAPVGPADDVQVPGAPGDTSAPGARPGYAPVSPVLGTGVPVRGGPHGPGQAFPPALGGGSAASTARAALGAGLGMFVGFGFGVFVAFFFGLFLGGVSGVIAMLVLTCGGAVAGAAIGSSSGARRTASQGAFAHPPIAAWPGGPSGEPERNRLLDTTHRTARWAAEPATESATESAPESGAEPTGRPITDETIEGRAEHVPDADRPEHEALPPEGPAHSKAPALDTAGAAPSVASTATDAARPGIAGDAAAKDAPPRPQTGPAVRPGSAVTAAAGDTAGAGRSVSATVPEGERRLAQPPGRGPGHAPGPGPGHTPWQAPGPGRRPGQALGQRHGPGAEVAPPGWAHNPPPPAYVPPPLFPRPDLPEAPRWLLPVVAAVGLVAAVALPYASTGLGLVLTAIAMGAAALPAVLGPGGRGLTPWTVTFGVLAYALVGVALIRDADWLVAPVLLAAFGVAALALSGGGTGWLGVIRGGLSVVLGLFPLPWFLSDPVKRLVKRRRMMPALVSVGITVVLLGVFGLLFTSADAVFSAFASRLLQTPEWAASLPFRIFLFGVFALLVAAAVLVALRPVAEPEGPDLRISVTRTVWVIPLVGLNLLFASFVAVQITVLFGGSRRVLSTAGLTYAEYARSGFFELVTVSVFVLGIVAAAAILLRLNGRRDRWLLAVLLGLLCGFTLVILASALHRLGLYTDAYGLSRLRASVGATIWWLAAVFVLVLVAGAVRLTHRETAWFFRSLVLVTGVGLLVFAAWDPDVQVAETQLAVRGIERLDHNYLGDLGAEAVPTLDRLPEPARSCVLRDVVAVNHLNEPDAWNGWNLARERARDVLALRPVLPTAECPGSTRIPGPND